MIILSDYHFFLPFQYIRRLQVKTHLSLFDYKLYGIYIATVNTLRFKLLYYSLHIIVGQTSIIMAFKTIYISIKKFNLVFFNFHTHLNVRFCCLYQNTRIFKLFTSLHFTLMPIGSMFFEYIIYKCIVQI